MRVNRLLLLFCLLIFSVNASAQNILDAERNSFKNLKDSCNGENWKFGDLEVLKKRSESPRVKATAYGIVLYDLRDNNLQGSVPDNFIIGVEGGTSENGYGHETSFDIYLSWNNITRVTSYIQFWRDDKFNQNIWLDHNNITSIDLKSDEDLWGEDPGGDMYSGMMELCLHNNEISEITVEQFCAEDVTHGVYSRFNNQARLVRLDNNRLRFRDLIPIYKHLKKRTAKVNYHTPGNPDFKFICAPQKALSDDNEEIVNAGDVVNMEFSLTRDDNVYQWTLNGKDVPLALGKNYSVASFTAEHAGVYRCKVTNSELEGVELYSGEFARFLSKDGNNAPADITISHDPILPGTPSFAVIGDFAATDADGDQVYFRIKGGKHASSFRIIEGKTLITAEDMFPVGAPETYEVIVEAYDIYGGKAEKTLSITKGEGSAETFPKDILLSANSVDENSMNEIGELTAVGVDGFSFLLPELKDNSKFVIEGNKIKPVVQFDYETKSVYSIRVKASKEGTSLTKDFTIKVNDVNDNPSDIVLSSNKVNKGNIPGSIVGYLVAVDQDPGDHVFEFTTESNEFFVENNILKTKKTFKEIGVESLTVKVKDQNDAVFSKSFNIQVIDPANVTENSAPTAIGLSNFIVKRDWTEGTQVSLLFMKDIDGDQGEFTIEDGDDSEYFRIDGYKLIINKELSDKTVYTITVKATDGTDSVTEKFSFYIPVVVNGIDNINEKDIIASAPNPVINNLYLEYEGSQGVIRFYNTSGNLVKQVALSDNIDCSDLTTGLYIVRATIDNNTSSFKIIKQ
jgi:hypothetical protein